MVGRLDAKGRLVKAQAAGLDSLAMTYDAQGRVSREQVGGRIWTYGYDGRSHLVRTINPVGRRDSLIYDDADRLTRRLLPGGRSSSATTRAAMLPRSPRRAGRPTPSVSHR